MRTSDLAEAGARGRPFAHEWLRPCQRLQELSKAAEEVATKLWFTETETMQMDDLIVCGKATMCFNLLRYMLEQHPQNIAASPLADIYARAESAWQKLNG